jgi:hypothetical protein
MKRLNAEITEAAEIAEKRIQKTELEGTKKGRPENRSPLSLYSELEFSDRSRLDRQR